MRFLINNRVIFDEDNLTLALADENADPVVLTAIANRLLALLVKNNNILISRDFIFSAVWEDHGKTASSSNLNNYIASLRRSFPAWVRMKSWSRYLGKDLCLPQLAFIA